MDNKQKKLEDLIKRQYYVILMKKNGSFYLHIPELSLIVEDKDLNKAHEKLENEKEAYFRKAVEMNLEDEIELPSDLGGAKVKKSLLSTFEPFFIKLCAVFIVGFILLSLTAAIARYVSYEIKDIPYEVINKINGMSEDDIQQKRLLLRNTFKKVKPFIEEFKTAFPESSSKKDH